MAFRKFNNAFRGANFLLEVAVTNGVVKRLKSGDSEGLPL